MCSVLHSAEPPRSRRTSSSSSSAGHGPPCRSRLPSCPSPSPLPSPLEGGGGSHPGANLPCLFLGARHPKDDPLAPLRTEHLEADRQAVRRPAPAPAPRQPGEVRRALGRRDDVVRGEAVVGVRQ